MPLFPRLLFPHLPGGYLGLGGGSIVIPAGAAVSLGFDGAISAALGFDAPAVSVVLFRDTDETVWNNVTLLFETADATKWYQYDVPLTQKPANGRRWFADVPTGAQGIVLNGSYYAKSAQGASLTVGDTFLGDAPVVTGLSTYTPPPAGHYTSIAAIQSIAPLFADLLSQIRNDTTDPDPTRYATAIASVEAWYNTELLKRGYAAPLPTTSEFFPTVADLATKDALVELYFVPRGAYDGRSDAVGGKLASLRYANGKSYTEGGGGVRDQWIDLLDSGALDETKTSPVSVRIATVGMPCRLPYALPGLVRCC